MECSLSYQGWYEGVGEALISAYYQQGRCYWEILLMRGSAYPELTSVI
jgi:hypothetical protein